MDIKDKDYIDFLLKNDSQGLEKIYQNFLPRIKKLITNNGGSDADALDVFQDALIILFEKARKADFVLKSKFYTLLYGVCRNLWGNRLQKKSFKTVTIEEDDKYIDEVNWSDLFLQQEEYKIYRTNFSKLGPDCQQLLKYFFNRTPMARIQEIMGYSSLGYTKKRKFQCKERLIKLIKSDPRYAEIMKDK